MADRSLHGAHVVLGELQGQVDNVCFAEGLVLFNDTWHLYYGVADSRIGCVTAPRR